MLAKFIVVVICEAVLALVIVIAGLVTGALIQLPGRSPETMLSGIGLLPFKMHWGDTALIRTSRII